MLGQDVSCSDIILMAGGLFLLAKATSEIHGTVEGAEHKESGAAKATSFASALVQILAIDLVFSLDSVITAVGMTDNLPIMVTAVVIAIAVMMFAALPIRSEEHTSELQSLMRISYAVFCLKKKQKEAMKKQNMNNTT